ncbi:MAG: zinc-binding dehydrogenase [Deltaproteobacteria bacterium]|nr:zinc-binding dehydrogenase [Deltaproteobacteria bacterium]
MKALVLDKPGKLNTLRIADVPMPEPGPGEVRLKVNAVGLNPVDYKVAASGVPGWEYPFILGLDVAGTVDTLGEGVLSCQVGNEVFYHGNLAKPGGYAEYAVAPAHILAKKPVMVTFADAAAIPCAGMTAYQILSRKIPVKQDHKILIHAAAGGVGGFAVQIARNMGLEIMATCSKRNFDHVRKLGADHLIDYNTEDVTQRVFDITGGRGADIAINTVDPETATKDMERLAFGGHLACVVGLPDFSVIEPFTKALSIHESALGGAHLSGDRKSQEDLAAMADELITMLRDGKIVSLLKETISMEEIPHALARLEERHVTGKIVAQI